MILQCLRKYWKNSPEIIEKLGSWISEKFINILNKSKEGNKILWELRGFKGLSDKI